MDPVHIIVSVLFSLAGSLLLVFGFKVRQFAFMLCGLALIACACAIGNLIGLMSTSILMGILPWVISKP